MTEAMSIGIWQCHTFVLQKKGKKQKVKTKTPQQKNGYGKCLGLPHTGYLPVTDRAGLFKIGQLGKRLTSRNLAFSYTLSSSSTSSAQLNWNLFKSDVTI